MDANVLSARAIVGVVGLAMVASGCGVKRGDMDNELATIRQEMQEGDQNLDARIDETDQRVVGLSDQLSGMADQIRALEQQLVALRSEFDGQMEFMEAAVRFNTPVHFEYDSDVVRDADHQLLSRFAEVVNKYYPDATVTVEGFTDPAGDPQYNLDLGERRAGAVRTYLTETGGLNADRVKSVSYGEARNRQVRPGQWGANGLSNRRVALVIDYLGDGAAMATNRSEQ